MEKWFEDRELLKATRKRLDLTQAELATRAKVAHFLIADVETGRRKMRGPQIEALWRALAIVEIEQKRMADLREKYAGVTVAAVATTDFGELCEKLSNGAMRGDGE